MKVQYISLVVAATVTLTAAASVGHDQAINGFFHDIQLVILGLRGLVEPIMALLLAVSLAMQIVIMKHQKQSKKERKEQTAILSAQNQVLDTVERDVKVVKDVQNITTLTSPMKEEN